MALGRQVGDGDAGLAHQLLRLIIVVDAAQNDPIDPSSVIQNELQELFGLLHRFTLLDLHGTEITLGEGVKVNLILEQRFDLHVGEVDLFLHSRGCRRCLGCRLLAVSRGFMVGKRMTSRMESLPVSSMTQRSMPMPKPPVGGIPYSRALT